MHHLTKFHYSELIISDIDPLDFSPYCKRVSITVNHKQELPNN